MVVFVLSAVVCFPVSRCGQWEGVVLVLFTSYSLPPLSPCFRIRVECRFLPLFPRPRPPSVFQGNLNLSLPLMHSLSFFKHLTPGTLSDIFSSAAYHLKPRLPDVFPTSSLISPLLVMTDPLRANILTQAAHAQV